MPLCVAVWKLEVTIRVKQNGRPGGRPGSVTWVGEILGLHAFRILHKRTVRREDVASAGRWGSAVIRTRLTVLAVGNDHVHLRGSRSSKYLIRGERIGCSPAVLGREVLHVRRCEVRGQISSRYGPGRDGDRTGGVVTVHIGRPRFPSRR